MTGPTIGELRHRFSLQAPIRADDGGGGAVVSWSTIADVSGALRPLSGDETPAADRLRGTISHELWMRYRDDVMPVMRFLLGARVFEIHAVIDFGERRRWLRCLVEERDL